jgi:hypothetical protein
VSALLGMVLAAEPLHDVEAFGPVELDWVAIKEIGHHDKVAVRSKLVSNELDVIELMANNIGDAGCCQSSCTLIVWIE